MALARRSKTAREEKVRIEMEKRHERMNAVLGTVIGRVSCLRLAISMGGTCKPLKVNCRESQITALEEAGEKFCEVIDDLNKTCFPVKFVLGDDMDTCE
jgi:hypothetical protein